jgi:hypothetical protein
MGLNLPIEEGFNFLGTRVIIVALTSLRSLPNPKYDLIAH